MKVQNYHELLSAYHRYLEDKGVLNKFLDYQNFVNGFIADDNLAFAKPEPLAKNKQTENSVKEITICQAGKDGECWHKLCPQILENEPETSGRHCPLDDDSHWEC